MIQVLSLKLGTINDKAESPFNYEKCLNGLWLPPSFAAGLTRSAIMSLFSLSCLLFSVLSTVSTLSLPHHGQIHPRDSSSNTTIIYEFPSNTTWFENLVQRSTGDILATRFDVCELYSISPSACTASLVHTFPNCSGALGITEIAPDTFVLLTGGLSLTHLSAPGSFVAWLVDYTGCDSPSDAPRVSAITTLADAVFLDGLTTWSPDVVLAGDASIGAVFALDVLTGSSSLVIQDPSMEPVPGAAKQLGINGLKVLRDREGAYLYYTNTDTETFQRMPVSNGHFPAAIGAPEVIATGFEQDDFALAVDGTAYVAGNVEPHVYEVTAQGQVSIAADVSVATAALFGKTSQDWGTLYVSGAEPAKIVAVKVDCKEWESCVNSVRELNL